jgi:hypothetical protein
MGPTCHRLPFYLPPPHPSLSPTPPPTPAAPSSLLSPTPPPTPAALAHGGPAAELAARGAVIERDSGEARRLVAFVARELVRLLRTRIEQPGGRRSLAAATTAEVGGGSRPSGAGAGGRRPRGIKVERDPSGVPMARWRSPWCGGS